MMQETLIELIRLKDQMEKTIAKLAEEIEVIDKTKGFEKGVIDNQGFPRQDLDFGELSNYRNLKRRKAQLNNDHLKLMKQIQTKLFQYHATLPQVEEAQRQVITSFLKNKQQKKQSQTQPKKQQMQEQIPEEKYVIEYLTPFAKISLVQQNSPADMGGIKVNDLLSQFSQVNIYTPDNIKQIPSQVRADQQLRIVVMRPVSEEDKGKYEKVFTLKDKNQYAKVQLKTTPKKWFGKGLMGCKIDPL